MIDIDSLTAQLGDRRVLDDVSLSVGAGELVAVCGANGSGKTSLMRAALGLIAISRGEVRLSGRPLALMSPRERACHLSYLPQERHIGWNLPAVEVAALGVPWLSGEAARDQGLRALSLVGLEALAGRGVADMSGGERARVLFARMLAAGAPLWLVDEPVAGLDLDAELMMMEIMVAHVASGGSVICSLHDLGMAARFADRVLVMKSGRIIADDAPRRALRPEVLAQAFGVHGHWVEGPDGPLLSSQRL
ncbi:MAG: ABC transporter ATP-binding protein [Brevundimonas sp.]|jgi:iron complex transport system ATP-binding protein|uniref:ABC transporter ATP-binding protein n=1 Tax=Brevundimonas sp. TaxID=1871086 RepID=UPI00391B2AC6